MMKAAGAPGLSLPHRVLLVDEAPLMREAVRVWLARDGRFQVCGEAAHVAGAWEQVERLEPRLVITELALPGRSGLELIKDLRAHHPEVRVLVFTGCSELLYAARALRAGARGYLHKRVGGEELLTAVRQVMADRIAVSAELALHLLEELVGLRKRDGPELQGLTDRELEVLRLLGEARTVREIATMLHLSPKTVETHRVNLIRKLGLGSSAELLRFALQFVEAELTGGKSGRRSAGAVTGPGPAERVSGVPDRSEDNVA